MFCCLISSGLLSFCEDTLFTFLLILRLIIAYLQTYGRQGVKTKRLQSTEMGLDLDFLESILVK